MPLLIDVKSIRNSICVAAIGDMRFLCVAPAAHFLIFLQEEKDMKKVVLLALIVATVCALFAVTTSAVVGEGFMNYGDIAKADYGTLGLDGEKDEAYNSATPIAINNQSFDKTGKGLAWYPRENGEAPASGTAYMVSDSEYLWIYVEVIDATLNTKAADAVSSKYTEDCVEVLIDWTNEALNIANSTPYQMRVTHEGYISGRLGQNGTTLQGTVAQGSSNPVEFFDGTAKHTENGYVCEFKIEIPASIYAVELGEYISIGINVNDYDSTGALSSRIMVSSDSVNGTNQWMVEQLGYARLGFDPYSGLCGENLTWSYYPQTGVLNILGSGAMDDFQHKSAPWYGYVKYISAVNIGDEVTHIGACAFEYCEKIISVVIPESVESIGEDAFWGCIKLVEVINRSDLVIEKDSYENGCVGYYCIEVHDGESKIVLKDNFKFYTDAEGVNYLFADIGYDGNVVLPESYNSESYVIYDSAFYKELISTIVIPEAVTGLGEYAFYNCKILSNVQLPESLEYIGGYAFAYCRSFTSIEIPENVEYIGDMAFGGCNLLEDIIIKSRDVELFDDEYAISAGATIYGYAGSTAAAYAKKYERNFVQLLSDVVFESKERVIGETFTVDVYFENMPAVKSFIIKNFIYDEEVVSLVSGKVNVEGAIAHWDKNEKVATVAFDDATDCNGAVLTLTFEVIDNVDRDIEISAEKIVVKTLDYEGNEESVALTVTAGKASLFKSIKGDINGDNVINTDDAIYLLRYTLLPSDYVMNQSGDMDGNGAVNSNDAIYLLRHILLPAKYPLN